MIMTELDIQEQEKPASTKPNIKQPVQCQECKLQPSKYKCPGCAVQSCSLPCVKAHKLRTGCTGKRNQTQFVPLSQFDDNLLLSDYQLLEEVKRVAESAQRTRAKLCGLDQYKLPYFLQSLRNAARRRRTGLLFLPNGMLKREKNRSRYNQRKKFIAWTIEWRFHSTDVVLLDHGVHEDTSICSVIDNHLACCSWNHKLREFSKEKLDSLKFFIRKYPKGPRSPYRELDIKTPIREQLFNLVILEYPVIHVFLPSHNFDFEIVRDVNPVSIKKELEESVSFKGIHLKEEEIEENDSSHKEHQVLDVMKHVNSTPMYGISNQNRMLKKPVNNNSCDRPLVSNNGSHSIPKMEEVGIFEDIDFDFDQGLIDAYADLIAEINPDDFLDLEGELVNEVQMEEERGQAGLNVVVSAEEELEEGEIPE